MKNPALLIVDVQEGMFENNLPEKIHEGPRLIRKVAGLLQLFRTLELPVIYIQHNGPKGHVLEPGTSGHQIASTIAPQAQEPVFQKTKADSFYKTDLQVFLTENNVQTLILCGAQTDYCVDTTCRSATAKDFNVVLAADAHSTWNRSFITAEQIIEHHNAIIGGSFGQSILVEDIERQLVDKGEPLNNF